ncbi:hypothetical protein M407DRAFT_14069 [Tulasnella calospora MUT 4182]|uniref:Phospholipid/glycerol acyltransferase domain-containing protein n=1 Tax=Tulasnella calospora MUT 4182 TaxID=1051891 RepID=A0A0C3LCE9_9AGAM|nr:hypothetical protein M407DRAFT_14069 [Tulasnella calospora MUT 4182]
MYILIRYAALSGKRTATLFPDTPVAVACSLLFKFVLNVFYGTIVVENEHYIPKNGEPVIVCSNHVNSLTDALLLVTSVSSKKRNFLRLTAKDSQFGRKTFSSWLIENAGTLPIQRRKEHGDQADNSTTMDKLLTALSEGDAICLFPEGMSRFHPTMAPLKTGVARIVSDVLTRNRDNPEFAVTLLTCSLTYVHRWSFRSDVLVSFNPPLKLTVKDTPSLISTPDKPVDFEAIKSLTTFMHAQLSSNTIDSPSWDLVRVAKTAARIYVPLGTRMRLGDWVRVVARFVEGLAKPVEGTGAGTGGEGVAIERQGMKRTAYQDQLNALGLKDDRIRQSITLSRIKILWRLFLRICQTCLFLAIAAPGLFLWVPVFATTTYKSEQLKRSGPVWDTHDEVAQTKLVYGLASGIFVWLTAIILTTPIFGLGLFFTIWFVPAWMWLTLRWTEDLIAAFRAAVALYRLLWVSKADLKRLRETREDLHGRVMNVATEVLGLPKDPEAEFLVVEGEEGDDQPSRWAKHQRGRTRGGWDSALRYFSIRRRRKRDWNETLRWFDATEFPKE